MSYSARAHSLALALALALTPVPVPRRATAQVPDPVGDESHVAHSQANASRMPSGSATIPGAGQLDSGQSDSMAMAEISL